MDNNLEFVIKKKIERTIKNLEKNNMNAYFVKDKSEIEKIIEELTFEGDTVAAGGSMTLFETGVIDFLRKGPYNFIDRNKLGLSKVEIKNIYLKSYSAEAYFSSANAITQDGWIYLVDGTGNRVSAILYGPEKVIIIVGINKIVLNLEEAIQRNKEIAAPANAKRLNRKTPCVKVGYCMDCTNEDRICNEYVLIKRQPKKGRIHVIIVDDNLGY